MQTLNILPAASVSIGGGTFTVTDNTFVEFVVDDDDANFEGDAGAPDTGVDTNQFLGGTTTPTYLENSFTATNGDGSWTIFVIESATGGGGSSGAFEGVIVTGGPGPIPTGDFTISGITNITGSNAPTFASLGAIPCLVRGTLVETTRGQIAVEDLEAGDMVVTRDRGAQPIRWVGSKTVAGQGAFAPICIAQGAMGNTRDLLVSPNHRMVLEGRQMEVLFGTGEALVAANLLVNDTNIRPAPMEAVEYFHVLFDQHEVIFAEGIPTESFHPGQGGVDALSAATRDEILQLFPQLEGDLAAYGPSARQVLTAAEYAAV